jgi:hypothetical protein
MRQAVLLDESLNCTETVSAQLKFHNTWLGLPYSRQCSDTLVLMMSACETMSSIVFGRYFSTLQNDSPVKNTTSSE